MNKNFKVLTSKEEKELSSRELKEYYKELREYLLNTKHEDNLTKGSLTVCKFINPIIRDNLLKIASNENFFKNVFNKCDSINEKAKNSLLRLYRYMPNNKQFIKDSLDKCDSINKNIKDTLSMLPQYEIIIDRDKKIDGLVGIYAHTHQSKDDHFNYAISNSNHTVLLNSSILSDKYKLAIGSNGVVYVDKDDKESRKKAKLELIRLLLNGKSITMFPESAWNCSPNKLHLPLYTGMIDIAKKTGVPIIPVLQEYTYDEEILDGVERIKRVYIKYGEPIYVNENDNLLDKLHEYSESISTMRWEFMEKNGVYERNTISNKIYTNHVKGCIRNLEDAGIDINVEKGNIYSANDDFYLFHHLNAVDFDENDNLLETEHVRKLIKINETKLKNVS